MSSHSHPSPRAQLSRRLFLSQFGRGTVAVAVLGTGLAACGSDGEAGPATSDDPDGANDGVADAEREGEEQDGAETSVAADGELRWERANFGFVSAYVLARGSEVAVVDTGTDGGQIETALSTLKLGWDDVNHVIVTHAHGDHVGGLDAVLTSAPNATGYAGVGDIEGLTAPRDLVAVQDGEEIFGLNIIGTPGHTPGHISVFDPASGLLVAGDAMVANGSVLAGPSAEFSDDIAQAEASVKAMAEIGPGSAAVKTILVGHGDPVTDDAAGQLQGLATSL